MSDDFAPLDFKKEGIVLDYKTAGVDIDAGNKFVEELKRKVPKVGGFGGMFNVPVGYEEPVLVSGTDGVGTKIDIAQAANCLLYTSPSPRDRTSSRMPSSA